MGINDFFAYARERYMIKLARDKQGSKAPWTEDPILQQYRFCNVFREDDRTTQWFRETVRDRYSDSGCVIMATIIFRWFNRIETGKVLRSHGLLTNWKAAVAKRTLTDLSPLVTGAYMIKTPARMTKLEGLIWCIANVWWQRDELFQAMQRAESLEWAHSYLMRYPYLGSFMAYEIVTDLRHTIFLEKVEDIDTWASAGPGAARGLGRVLFSDPDRYSYTGKVDQEDMLKEMRNLLACSRSKVNWPPHWPNWEMREVEHTLCEFDKYERARLGEGRPKQRFTPCT